MGNREKNVIPTEALEIVFSTKQLSDFAEGKEIKDIFRKELKDIE